MFSQLFNWRTVLALVGILIVTGTIFYSRYVANKIAEEEKEKVEQWVEATKSLNNPDNSDVNLPFRIIQDNNDIPIIETNERDSITNHVNLDSAKAATDPGYLQRKLKKFKSINTPITW